MATSNTFLYIALGFASFMVLGYVFYAYIYKRLQKQKSNSLIRILLFEQIGDDKIFRGLYDGFEATDEKLGAYIFINRIKVSIGLINNSDYFPDKNFGKCLLLCKYSTDDYRVISRLKTGEWFKKVKLDPQKYLKTQTVLEGEEEITKLVMDENNKPVRLVDDDGNPVPDFDLEQYDEPLGVTQSDREVMRFNRDFSRRMQEKRGESNSFWDKYGSLIVSISIVMIAFIFMAYNTNKTNETMLEISTVFGEKADSAIKEMSSPTFAESLLNKIEERNNNEDSPPK